jgi:hypothetical protein
VRDDALPQLLDAAAVARMLGVTRGWVYEHAAELGAIRLGAGSRPRLRFDPLRVGMALEDGLAPQLGARRTHRFRRSLQRPMWSSCRSPGYRPRVPRAEPRRD